MEPMALGSPLPSPTAGGHSSPPHYPNSGSFSHAAHSSMQYHTPPHHGLLIGGGGGQFQQQQQQHLTGVGGLGTPGGSGFLPGYLMGDYSQQSSGRMMSPSKMSSHHPQTSTPQAAGPFGALQSSTPTSKGFLTPNASHLRTPSAADKPGGPPTSGLFSTPKFGGTPKRVPALTGTPRGAFGVTPVPTTPQMSFGATPGSTPNHNASVREEIFNASSSQISDETTWVTVFGFPPSAASFILSQFSQYGTILQHHIPPNGNWMHLKYQTKMQAQKALGKSNRILGGSIMIGVSRCTDPNLDESAVNLSSVHNRSQVGGGYGTPMGAGETSTITTLNLGGARLNSSIRPLAQAYKAASCENEIASKASTPNRNTGLVGKAMEYIFGW